MLFRSIHHFARVGHRGLLDWAQKSGKSVAMLDPRHTVFLYNRHRQSSSRFASRRSTAREHPNSRTWVSADFRAFNLDLDRLLEFRLFAAAAPYAKDGSAWTASDEQTSQAFEQWKTLVELKARMTADRAAFLKDAPST